MQSAQDRTAKNVTDGSSGARRVFAMAQEIAFGDEFESSRFDFLAQYAFFNAMEGFSN